MIVTTAQIRMARAALRLSQADIATRAGISKTAYHDLESGASSPRASTISAIQAVLERDGARFSADGGCKIVPKTEAFIAGPGTPSAKTRRLALQVINAGRAARNLPLIRDDDDE